MARGLAGVWLHPNPCPFQQVRRLREGSRGLRGLGSVVRTGAGVRACVRARMCIGPEIKPLKPLNDLG